MTSPNPRKTLEELQKDQDRGVGVDLIQQYCANLSLSFEKAIASDFQKPFDVSAPKEDLSSKRLIYHRSQESIRNQILYTIAKFKQLHSKLIDYSKKDALRSAKPEIIIKPDSAKERVSTKCDAAKDTGSSATAASSNESAVNLHRKFQVALVTSDILPETGEYMAKLLIDSLICRGKDPKPYHLQPNQILVLGRRPDIINTFTGEYGVNIKADWEEDPAALVGVSLVVVLCSSMHITLVQEQLQYQDLNRIVIFAAIRGVLHQRLCSLFKTEKVLLPTFDFANTGGEASSRHDIIWNQSVLSQGYVLPDLDHLRKCMQLYCESQGCEGEQSRAIIKETLSQNAVLAIEEFHSWHVARMNIFV
ncbi:hypothetical protein HDU97_000027 [Phlyctochytrium planicorne]|nr:hypothetical protein HDU97_000027 [Phlyctochytrium planicorne]